MKTRQHIHEEQFPVSPERLFTLLHTPSAIRCWWEAESVIVVAEEGGIWCATWGDSIDEPDYVTTATIKVFEPAKRMLLTDYRYFTKSGILPFEADFSVDFLVAAYADGATLKVIQDGFPADPSSDAFLAACEVGWTDTFAGIRRYLDTHKPS